MSDTDMTCRGCRYQLFRDTTDSTGLKASIARCGKMQMYTVFARMPFELAAERFPELDPGRWCGPSAALRQEHVA